MRIIVVPNGDLLFKCELCAHQERLPKTAQASVFWEMYVGNIALVLIQHEIDNHEVGPRRQAGTEPMKFDTGPRHAHRK